MLVIGATYEFGELKAGDKFAYHGQDHEKISGNLADVLVGINVVGTVPMPPEARVVLIANW